MWIVIDRERLCVIYKHEDQNALVSLANIEIPEAAIVVMSATDPDSYDRFTDFELKVLFENMCGQKHTGYNRPFLIKSVVMLVGLLKETDLNPNEVEKQLEFIENGGKEDQWQYIYGQDIPLYKEDQYAPNALVTVAGYVPVAKRYHVPRTGQRTIKQAAGVNPMLAVAAQNTEGEVRAPRVRSEGPAAAPQSGSKTGKVWEIAEQCYAKHGQIDKTLRKMVADACEAAGINSSTMSVQWSKWKTTKNI